MLARFRARSTVGAATIAVVTGATRGIGLALTRALLDRGATVYAIGRDPARLAQLQGRLRQPTLQPRRLDVADGAAFAALLDEVQARHGRLDWLVNNAGIVGGRRAGRHERRPGARAGRRQPVGRLARQPPGRRADAPPALGPPRQRRVDAAVMPVPYSASTPRPSTPSSA